MNVLQITIFGVLLGGVYALMATGLTMLYGVMRVINLAHAAFMIVGAYIAFVLFRDFGIDPLLSMLVTGPALFLVGVLLYQLLFKRIVDSPRFTEMTVLLSFGLALAVEGILGAIFSNIYHSTDPGYATGTIDVGSVFIPTGQLYGFLASLVLLAALWLFLYYTKTGYAIRATMQDRSAAQIVGVNVDRISALAFGIGVGLAGAAGSLLSYLFTFFPGSHLLWIGLLLSLIVVGGLGSLIGAFVGAVGLSVIAAFATDQLGPEWSYLTFYVLLFVILLIRPQGLFGRAETI
ncbi:MAG TPA: branched-chain amino acid ABC transporter permease [Solirubrobacterales bacterium]|nr:branched-chain amino acid ABC transporter permease [Solirubrobacterales bacterium]